MTVLANLGIWHGQFLLSKHIPMKAWTTGLYRSVATVIEGPSSNTNQVQKKTGMEMSNTDVSPHSPWINSKGSTYFCKVSMKKTSLSHSSVTPVNVKRMLKFH